MRNKKKSEPFKSFETEEEWREAVGRIVDMVWEKISARFPNLFEAEQTGSHSDAVSPSGAADAEDVQTESVSADTGRAVTDGEKTVTAQQLTREQAEARVKEVRRQAEEFKRKNPGFDMEKELQNKHFCYLVFKAGVSVEDAYFLLHRDEVKQAGPTPRISENGATRNQGISTKLNPEKLSDEDVAKILERIQDGEQITF